MVIFLSCVNWTIGSPRQKTTIWRRENHLRDFHKADFGLRLRAGLSVPNRCGISPGLQPMELVISQRADSNRE